ncbi:MAG: alpha/beta fold hydrolase [Pseudomonadota bacterium]
MLSTLALAALIVYALIALAMFLLQPRMLFVPARVLHQNPSAQNLRFEDIHLTTADGVRIHGWLVAARTTIDHARQTVLFLHGNGGNIADRMDSLAILSDFGFDVFIIDYRGYGRSEGKPSEEGTYRDAMAAWEFLVQDRGLAPESIVILGRSLGGAIATWLAANVTPGGLIVESTFRSLPTLAARLYPWLPARYLTRFRYDSLGHAPRIKCPVLVVHSREDELIPFDEGEKLFAALSEPKTFLEIRGDHASGYAQSGEQYWPALAQFVRLNSGHAVQTSAPAAHTQ